MIELDEMRCRMFRAESIADLNTLYESAEGLRLSDEAKTQLVGHKGLPARALGPFGSTFGLAGAWVTVGDYHHMGDYTGDLDDPYDNNREDSLWVVASVEHGLIKASRFFYQGQTLDLLDPYWDFD